MFKAGPKTESKVGDRLSRFRRQDGTGDGSDDQVTTGRRRTPAHPRRRDAKRGGNEERARQSDTSFARRSSKAFFCLLCEAFSFLIITC
jgi:hypothetical protein